MVQQEVGALEYIGELRKKYSAECAFSTPIEFAGLGINTPATLYILKTEPPRNANVMGTEKFFACPNDNPDQAYLIGHGFSSITILKLNGNKIDTAQFVAIRQDSGIHVAEGSIISAQVHIAKKLGPLAAAKLVWLNYMRSTFPDFNPQDYRPLSSSILLGQSLTLRSSPVREMFLRLEEISSQKPELFSDVEKGKLPEMVQRLTTNSARWTGGR